MLSCMKADPRHAEMLIKSFNLEGAKPVVTPRTKQPNDDEDLDVVDVGAAVAIWRRLAEAKRPRPTSKVSFSDHVGYVDVCAYSQIHGRHPRTFISARII